VLYNFLNKEMKNTKHITVPNSILANIDFANTINGGSVEPHIHIQEQDQAFELTVVIPSLATNALHIEVIDDNLWLYQLLPVLQSAKKQGYIPRTFGNITLPANIDKEHINAHNTEGVWYITLPKNNNTQGYRKTIQY
jgi:HSP20 family protein